MGYLIVKALISGVIVAVVSEVAKRFPGFGALIASLPLISILGIIWLWRDTGDRLRIAEHAQATFSVLLRAGMNLWLALALASLLTIGLYFAMVLVLQRFGVRL
jgi:hypothetical protein